MSNVQSYNALIDRFKAFASGHFILKRFSHGQIEVSDLEKFGEYPFMHVVPSNVTYAKGMKTFSFQIVLADMPRDKEDKTEYQREVLSDLQRIAEDLVAEITNHRVLFGDLITVNNVSLEPFLEEFQHTLTGWTVSLDLLVPYYWDACSIPAEWNDFFESSTGGTGSILTFIDSITRDENGNVSLVNDEAEPSPNYYYGTNDEGVRGWYLLSDEVGLTCVTLPTCQTIIDIEAAIDLLQQDVIDLNADVALKANTADISAVGFSNDYNDLDNKPTIPPAITNTSELVNDGEDGVNPFITAQDLPDTSGFVPYTGATQNVDLGTHTLSAKDLVINHSSGSGVAASITKGGAGEALTVNKTSGSGNAMSVTGGVTQLSELHLTTDLADAYIASAATWNAKFNLPSLTSGSVLFSNGTTIAQDNANFFWDDTNNRLGIGTATPAYGIDVNGTARISGTFNNLTVTNQGGATPALLLEANRSGWFQSISIKGGTTVLSTKTLLLGQYDDGNALIFNQSAADIIFSTNSTERFRLKNSGNLLINTTTDAGFKLDVNGSVRTTGSISAASAIARGTFLNQTLVATANNDVLVGLDVASTFTNGAFTGVSNIGLRLLNTASAPVGGVANSPSLILQGSIWNSALGSRLMRGGLLMTAATYPSFGNNINPTISKMSFLVASENAEPTEQMSLTSNGRLIINGGFVGVAPNTNNIYNLTLDNSSIASVSTTFNSNKLVLKGKVWNSGQGSVNNMAYLMVSNITNNANPTVDKLSIFVGSGINTNAGDTNGNATERLAIRTDGILSYFNSSGTEVTRIVGSTGNFLIGTTTDVASSILTLESTTKGFLPPRMTTTQKNAIASPAVGLVVYDTTLNKLCVRGASAWETITSV